MPLISRYFLPGIALVIFFMGLSFVLFFATQSSEAGSFWSGIVLEIQAIQRDLHRQLAAAMQAVQAEGSTAAGTLIFLSFLYGVFHAAGPGHGKVVISTYLLTQESQLRRGLFLSLFASLFQGLTAIVVVEATVGLLGLSFRQAQGTATNIEILSYALVALVGLILIVTRGRRLALWRRNRKITTLQTAHAHNHEHNHGQDHSLNDTHAACGHSHSVSQSDLETPLSWRGLAGMVISIGLRPCSGAVLILLVAYSLDLRLAGLAAVLAISLGTALTVSLLATLSVYARKGALRLAKLLPDEATNISVIIDLIAVLGGTFILTVGILLFQAAWTTPTHPLL